MLADNEIAPALEATNAQLEASREIVQSLANELANTIDVIEPTLNEFTKKLRTARMATLEEIRQVTASLREVRQFLAAAETEKALVQGERLIAMVTTLHALQTSGVIRALANLDG